MINMYEEIRSSLQFARFEIGEMLFVEYTCPIEDESAGIWTPMDSFIHVLSGRKSWKTTQGCWTAEQGQTLYIKKGASIIDQHLDEDFCVLLLFVTDDFIADCVREMSGQLKTYPAFSEDDQRALSLRTDLTLSSYFQSMLSYFSEKDLPSEPLLRLKLKELILSILLTDRNPELASYFQSLIGSTAPGLKQIMEANFCFNLSLTGFAELCNRSLSTFKRDFQTIYRDSPGRWLTRRRLEYAAVLLGNPELQVTQVSLQCGFEDLSHFSRTFKAKFGSSPAQFRKGLTGSG
jgi:AraC-like DNA-binding protein